MTASAGRGHASGSIARTVAQAKVNLVLRVLARETSGYHQIETLFCRLELGDDVVVRTNVAGRSLDCSGDVIPAGGLGATERNLAWRAAAAYADATGWPNAWAIEITKRIPIGGGLGGGSADAGAVLRCLNALSPTPISEAALVAVASALGSDVPFLTLDASLALGWGRGERLLALSALPSRPVVLVCFPFEVPTPSAYGWLDEDATTAGPSGLVLRPELFATWDAVARLAHNDFEPVVSPRYDDIARVLAALRTIETAHHDASRITLLAGSGATVFAIADDAHDMSLTHGPASRIVHTRTANRVVAVEVSD
jgi:4-diphosphocytidyl-2-C-methyl-D-erythritol kinase